MKFRLPIIVVSLICLVPAVSGWRHRARRDHVNSDIILVTDVATQTVIDWHTILSDQQRAVTPVATEVSRNTAISVAPVTFAAQVPDGAGQVARSDGNTHEEPVTADFTRNTTATTNNVSVVTGEPGASSPQSTSSNVHIMLEALIPSGKKARLSGYVGIEKLGAFSELAPYISWYSDYTPDPPTINTVLGVGMLWGAHGSPCGNEVNSRLSAFKKITEQSSPDIMFGFYEPDCYCADSSEMSASAGTLQWNELLAPLGKQGTILGSPSMCKQKDEDWLQPFAQGGLDHDWHITSVHINKPDLDGIKEDIEYYASTYGRPIWVSEFACVHDKDDWIPCTDQNEINNFINDAVEFFERNNTVIAYGPSNGNGLGNIWPLTDAAGDLTDSGQTYLNAVKRLS